MVTSSNGRFETKYWIYSVIIIQTTAIFHVQMTNFHVFYYFIGMCTALALQCVSYFGITEIQQIRERYENQTEADFGH